MNIQKAAQLALDSQSACNLIAVLHSYVQIMKDVLRPEADRLKKGSDWVHRHPISVLFATQVGHLTCVAVLADDACDWGKCYEICTRLANGEDVDPSELPYEVEKARANETLTEVIANRLGLSTEEVEQRSANDR